MDNNNAEFNDIFNNVGNDVEVRHDAPAAGPIDPVAEAEEENKKAAEYFAGKAKVPQPIESEEAELERMIRSRLNMMLGSGRTKGAYGKRNYAFVREILARLKINTFKKIIETNNLGQVTKFSIEDKVADAGFIRLVQPALRENATMEEKNATKHYDPFNGRVILGGETYYFLPAFKHLGIHESIFKMLHDVIIPGQDETAQSGFYRAIQYQNEARLGMSQGNIKISGKNKQALRDAGLLK